MCEHDDVACCIYCIHFHNPIRQNKGDHLLTSVKLPRSMNVLNAEFFSSPIIFVSLNALLVALR